MKRALLALLLFGCATTTAPPFIPPPAPDTTPPQAAAPTPPADGTPAPLAMVDVMGSPPARPAYVRFDPPPGPVTDFCAFQLDVHIRGREEAARLGTSAENEEAMRNAWEGCRRNLEEQARQKKVAEEIAAADKWRAEQKALHEAEEAEAQEKREQDPKWEIPHLSSMICDARAKKAAALREIAEERRVARSTGGGVVDLRKIYDLQTDARDAATEEKDALEALRTWGPKQPLPCNSAAVRNAD